MFGDKQMKLIHKSMHVGFFTGEVKKTGENEYIFQIPHMMLEEKDGQASDYKYLCFDETLVPLTQISVNRKDLIPLERAEYVNWGEGRLAIKVVLDVGGEYCQRRVKGCMKV